MSTDNKIQSILGVDVRARRKQHQENQDYDPFRNILIHKRIDGTVIAPLDMGKIWGI